MATDGIDIAHLFRKKHLQRSRDLQEAGLQRIVISRLVAAGKLKRLSRGLYCLPRYRQSEFGDLAVIAASGRDVIICLLSALRFHGLTTQAPAEIWIAIPNKARVPRYLHHKPRITRFSEASLKYGVEERVIEGVCVRMTTVEKTIADCFRFRNKVGLDVAIEALREASEKRILDRDELWRCAKIDRITHVIQPYMEALA